MNLNKQGHEKEGRANLNKQVMRKKHGKQWKRERRGITDSNNTNHGRRMKVIGVGGTS